MFEIRLRGAAVFSKPAHLLHQKQWNNISTTCAAMQRERISTGREFWVQTELRRSLIQMQWYLTLRSKEGAKQPQRSYWEAISEFLVLERF